MIPVFSRPHFICTCILPCFFLLLSMTAGFAQPRTSTPFKGFEHLFTPPKQYHVAFSSIKPEIDGDLTDAAWKDIPWSTNFLDIEGNKKRLPALKTRCKMIWDKENLYIAAELDEPHVWANIKDHDDIIFYDNDFEVFIDPDGDSQNYFEIEVNAANVTWDLFLAKPYRNLGHALFNWEAKGMKTAVKVQGTINNPTDIDKGWSVEMAIPYRALQLGNELKVPKPGDIWRINFSRVEWDTEIIEGKYVKKKDSKGQPLPEHNWVWSPQGVINMHLPERWGYLQFDMASATPRALPADEQIKRYLWLGYYKQIDHMKKNRRFATTLKALDLSNSYMIGGKPIKLSLEALQQQFRLELRSNGRTYSINQDGMLKML